MPRQKSQNELESLRRQQIELAKRIKEAEEKQRQKEKADDERRYLLAGAAAFDHMKAEPTSPFAATLLGLINARVKGAADRALFGLPPLSKQVGPPPALNEESRSHPCPSYGSNQSSDGSSS